MQESMSEVDLESRDSYILEQKQAFSEEQNEEIIPKGVKVAQAVLTVPLVALTGYLCVMSPMAANPAFIDPDTFAAVARSSIRLLSLNIAFSGGVHFGFGAAQYESAVTDEELKRVKY